MPKAPTFEHNRKRLVEEFLRGLNMEVLQAVVVRQRNLWHGMDVFRCSRLFVVSKVGDEASYICEGSGERPYADKGEEGAAYLLEQQFEPSWRKGIENPPVKHVLAPGKAYFMPERVRVKWQFAPGLVMTAVHFRLELLPGQDVSSLLTPIFKVTDCARVAPPETFINCMERYETMGDLLGIIGQILHYTSAFVDLPIHKIQEIILLRHKYNAVYDWLKGKTPALRTVTGMASVLGMSIETLNRHLRHDLDMSPKQLIDNHTLQCAIRELTYSQLAIKEIAALLGFASHSYFSRFVKKHLDMTPQAFRRSLTGT